MAEEQDAGSKKGWGWLRQVRLILVSGRTLLASTWKLLSYFPLFDHCPKYGTLIPNDFASEHDCKCQRSLSSTLRLLSLRVVTLLIVASRCDRERAQ